MIRKKVAILTAKKKEHNAMHVCLETTKLNIAAKTNIFVSYREEEYFNEKELHDIAKDYDKVRK